MKLDIQKFAVTFTGKEVTGNYSWAKIQGRVICEETYVGTSAENKSTVKCTVQARVTTGGTTAANWRAGATVGGDAKTGKLTTNTKFTDSWKTIKEFTFDVPHDEDGSKVVAISGYAQAPEYATSLGDAKSTFSGTMTLTTIPRESSISVNKETATLGDTIRVTIDRKSSSFSENLTFILSSPDTGSQNVEAVGVSDTYYDYVITEETYKYLTGTQGFLTISGTTLDGNDKVVASTNTVSVEILTPDSMIPSVEIGDLYENGTIVPSSWGVFVKGKSEIGVPVTSTGINGSTIKNISMKDSNDSGVYVINGSSGIFSTNKVKSNGTLTITATDTRGKTASDTVEYEVVDYSNPKLTTYTAKKVNSEGAEDDNGQNIMFSIEGTISSCGGNNVKKLYVAVNNQTNWISVADDTVDAVLSDTTIDPNVKNTVYFKIEDSLGGSEIKSVPIDGAFRLMNFNKTLTSVALGKKSSAADNEKLFEVDMDSKFYKDIEVTNVVSRNLFDKNNLIEGYRLDSVGSLYAEPGYSATGFIKVEPNTTYTRSKTGTFLSGMECFVEYDSDKNFISRKTDGNRITTTSETQYIRLSVQTSDIDTMQFEQGSATPYVPYLNLEEAMPKLKVISVGKTNYVKQGYISAIQFGNIVVVEVSELFLTEDRNEWVTFIGWGLPKPYLPGGGFVKGVLIDNRGVCIVADNGQLYISQRTNVQLANTEYNCQITYMTLD